MNAWQKATAAMVLGTLIGMAGCSGSKKEERLLSDKSATQAHKVVKIGTLSPLSGEQSSGGESIRFGAELAVAEMQQEFAKAGFDLALVPEDDQANKEVAPKAGERLMQDKQILGVVGTLNSGTALPVSEQFAADGLVLISPSNTNPKLTERGLTNYFRVVSRDDIQGPSAVRYSVKTLQAKAALIAFDKDGAYGEGLAEQFKTEATKLGLKVVGSVGFDPKETNFRSVVEQVKQQQPDVILFGGIYNTGALLVKQLREAGYTGHFFGADGMDYADAVKLAGKHIVGTYYTSVFGDVNTTSTGKEWVGRYKGKFGRNPDAVSAYAYDSTVVLLKAILQAGKNGELPTRKAVAAVIAKTKGYQGVIANVTFDSKGDNQESKVYVWQYREDKYPGSLIGTAE